MPEVRVAEQADAPRVAELMTAFRNHIDRSEPSDAEIRSTVERLLADPNTEFLLADEGVCQLRYRLSVWTSTEDCWLEDLYVTDGARGTGIGRALIEAAFDRARARGCERVQLDVDFANTRAIEVYKAAGFGTEPGDRGRTMLISRWFANAS
jgi:GNAT superfamily N-acetyltransferase